MNGTGNHVMRMQQEAAERVQRMQEHSRRLVREHPVNVYRGVSFTPNAAEESPNDTAPKATLEEQHPTVAPTVPEGGLAALLQGDEEQTLVLLLAVILAKNGAPLELVLALLYIAM